MAKTPTTDAATTDKTKAAAAAADEQMPEIEDDFEPGVAAAEADEDETPARKPPRREVETADDDPRAAAVRKYREIRDREEAAARAAKEADAQPPEDLETADDLGGDDADDGNDQQAEKAPEPPARKYTLKINGKEEEVSEAELISLAQIAKASDNLLDVAKSRASEATRLLKEAEETQRRLREGQEHPPAKKPAANQPDQSREQPDPEHQPVAGLDRERLRQITERIQVGDADEGAQALTDLFEEITAKVTPKVDSEEIARVVQRTNAQTRTQAELDAAFESFASKYPDIAKDELLAEAGKTVLRKEIIKDLESAGVDEATISSFARDERLLVQAHKDLRAANKGVRSYADLLETTGKTLSDRFNIKAASPQPATKTAAQQRVPVDPDRIQDRIDRKRAAPQQPRAVGVRQQVAPPPQPRTTRDIVRAMRKGRGFTLSD